MSLVYVFLNIYFSNASHSFCLREPKSDIVKQTFTVGFSKHILLYQLCIYGLPDVWIWLHPVSVAGVAEAGGK